MSRDIWPTIKTYVPGLLRPRMSAGYLSKASLNSDSVMSSGAGILEAVKLELTLERFVDTRYSTKCSHLLIIKVIFSTYLEIGVS
jgi:hypothetical protein